MSLAHNRYIINVIGPSHHFLQSESAESAERAERAERRRSGLVSALMLSAHGCTSALGVTSLERKRDLGRPACLS